MRPTNEISDPVWQDIWDRDEEIEQLKEMLKTVQATLSKFVGKEIVWCSRCGSQLTTHEYGMCLSCESLVREAGNEPGTT